MEKIKEKISKMATDIEKDIENLRESNPEQLIGAEIMALNALCNAAKTLKKIGQVKNT